MKIRGFRIELGEIENRLTEFPGISEATVIAREDTVGDKRLVAYYTTAPAAEKKQSPISVDLLKSHLLATLPEYMVPAAYIHLQSMPLTHNGKLDRKALPAPDLGSYSTRSYEPPVGETETRLAAIWADVLKIDRVGRHDNFFDLGGNSLLAVQLLLGLQQFLPGESMPLTALLESPTVERFAAWLQSRESKEQKILVQLRQGNSRFRPFFCAHASDGVAMG